MNTCYIEETNEGPKVITCSTAKLCYELGKQGADEALKAALGEVMYKLRMGFMPTDEEWRRWEEMVK